jgi:hypothetical protein
MVVSIGRCETWLDRSSSRPKTASGCHGFRVTRYGREICPTISGLHDHEGHFFEVALGAKCNTLLEIISLNVTGECSKMNSSKEIRQVIVNDESIAIKIKPAGYGAQRNELG